MILRSWFFGKKRSEKSTPRRATERTARDASDRASADLSYKDLGYVCIGVELSGWRVKCRFREAPSTSDAAPRFASR